MTKVIPKNNKLLTIGIMAVSVVVIGFLIASGGKDKVGTPAPGGTSAQVAPPTVDQHGHPLPANITAASPNELTNKPAPYFTLTDRNGKTYSLDELRGKNVILFFNEGLMCYPACWNQIVALAKDDRFQDSNTVVLSVVVDSPQDWQKAIEKMPELAQATVVFDKNAEVSKQFGMLTTASSMHYGSLPGHTYVAIDKEGIIRYVFDDPNMGVRNDELAKEIASLK